MIVRQQRRYQHYEDAVGLRKIQHGCDVVRDHPGFELNELNPPHVGSIQWLKTTILSQRSE